MLKPILPLILAAAVTITTPGDGRIILKVSDRNDKPEAEGAAETFPILRHTVQRGETLSKLGVEYGIPWREIAEWNGKEDTRIYAGEEILIKLEPRFVYASYYGCEDEIFHGRPMANGEPFDENDSTIVAHKRLPLGTRIRVLYPETGRALEMVVKDRGPYRGKRVIDLSCAAAEDLGTRKEGVTKVLLSVLELPS